MCNIRIRHEIYIILPNHDKRSQYIEKRANAEEPTRVIKRVVTNHKTVQKSTVAKYKSIFWIFLSWMGRISIKVY